jgi:hypothetical protein
MIFRIGIENNNDDRSIAWSLEHPGCFAYGVNSEQAQKNFGSTVFNGKIIFNHKGHEGHEGEMAVKRHPYPLCVRCALCV